MKRLSVAAIVLASIAIAGEIFIFATQKDDSDTILKNAIKADYRVYSPPVPDTLSFCGEAVPIGKFYVRESLDRELLSNMYFQSNTLLYIKRAARYFPTIERILAEEKVPSDMKYLCVIESGLQCVTSPAGAGGYWQFMKTTGGRYGLEINDEVDMRNHIEASTRAACRYLKDLHQKFGRWTEAAAAYNCGENGLAKRLASQEEESYYDLLLNQETQRYVYRILAIKLILQHPQDYGYNVRRCDTYPELPTVEVRLAGQNVDLVRFAKENGTSYKMLRQLNPWLTSSTLKNKANHSYTILIPTKKGIEYSDIVRGHHDTSLIETL